MKALKKKPEKKNKSGRPPGTTTTTDSTITGCPWWLPWVARGGAHDCGGLWMFDFLRDVLAIERFVCDFAINAGFLATKRDTLHSILHHLVLVFRLDYKERGRSEV